MSLKVWLPLNGDLENKGISNFPVTNNGATVNTSGKIGSCYSFNGSSNYLASTYNFYNSVYSVSAWIYTTSTSATQTIVCDRTTVGYGFSIFLIGGKIRIDPGGNNVQWTTSYTYPANTWFHLVVTYDGTKVAYYINGVLQQTYTAALTVSYWGTTTSIGASQANGSGYGNYLNGRLNDIRIYDHCLSAAEVKEISQGLVLHYKLDTHYLKSGTNLVTDVTKGGQTTKLTDGRLGVITSGVNADTYFTINLSESIVSGTTYHFSCDASGISNGQYWNFPLGAQNNTSLPCKIYNGHNEFVFTANNIDWGTNRLFMDDLNRTDWANPATFYNFVLTKDATYEVKDSSGYNNNGIITGTTTIAEDSPRYPFAISMNNTSTTNHIESINDITLSDNISVSFWLKASKSTSQVIFSTKNIQFGILNSLGYVLPSSAAGYQLTDFVTNSWNHICVVKNAGTFTLYVNGNKPARSGSNNYYVHNVDKLWLFNRSYNSSYGANASISDFRFYATPLLDNDVISLYNVGMKIDNQQQVHTFEGFEQLSNIMYKPNLAIGAQEWKDGLNRYQQPNCQVSLTENGVYVYRPANLSQANDGNTMYGGLEIVNSAADTVHAYDSTIDNIFNLQKNHTYVWIFYVKGNTTNAPGFQVTNNMGWGGGGLTPSPSNVEIKNIPTNFDGETEVWYKFTISDDIVKTCTSSYSSFVANTQYLSYKHFGWNWSYATTGNGTDIYITNIRLYDITDIPIGKLTKTGITKFSSIFEVNDSIHITKNEDLIVNQFIER